MTIDSQKVQITADQQTIADFLSDAQNLIHLLPQDKITDFKADANQCSFKVQGGITISLVEDGTDGPSQLFLKSGDASPFPFRLTIHTAPNKGGTEGYIHFEGQVNPFMKMIVEKPLTHLFDYMSNKLKEYYA